MAAGTVPRADARVQGHRPAAARAAVRAFPGAARPHPITIVGATSGDTGSAAIEACAGRAHEEDRDPASARRISEVQRRQMTTVAADNVRNVAIEGTFDDCQSLVKALFNDAALRSRATWLRSTRSTGADHGPGGLLCRGAALAGRGAGELRRADGQFRRRVRRLRGTAWACRSPS